ncbi:MAG: metalloregulator ArsR/SmtB family transcription factor [Bacilli bacterium]|nr:metalloregulator ArsR/SmtB family transcription factor [Bacilli bacterium]
MEKKELMCDCNIIHQNAVNIALKNKPKEKELENLTALFKILGDSTRTKILWILDHHEMCVCDIANVLNMTKSSISHQLAILREAGIVRFRRNGKEVYYTLDDEHISRLYEIGLEHINHKLKGEDYA